jgi:hypothetical protein
MTRNVRRERVCRSPQQTRFLSCRHSTSHGCSGRNQAMASRSCSGCSTPSNSLRGSPERQPAKRLISNPVEQSVYKSGFAIPPNKTYLSAKLLYASIFLAVVLLGFLVPNSRWYVINPNSQFSETGSPIGIVDEHAYYASATGLINFQRNVAIPNSDHAQEGLRARQNHDKVAKSEAIGYFGYEAGPQVHVLDDWALGDPLLARLPLSSAVLSSHWRIGHFRRDIPPGYLETLEKGSPGADDGTHYLQYPGRHHQRSGADSSTDCFLPPPGIVS